MQDIAHFPETELYEAPVLASAGNYTELTQGAPHDLTLDHHADHFS